MGGLDVWILERMCLWSRKVAVSFLVLDPWTLLGPLLTGQYAWTPLSNVLEQVGPQRVPVRSG